MERKSGMPELVEMPAPVMTRMRLEEWIVSAMDWRARWSVVVTVVVGMVASIWNVGWRWPDAGVYSFA